jgi:hypothetical protein
MLLAQSKGLERRAEALVMKPPHSPTKTWLLAESIRDVTFCQADNSEGESASPTTTPSNTKTNQLFENKRQLTAICN